jgi:hypothetical protein
MEMVTTEDRKTTWQKYEKSLKGYLCSLGFVPTEEFDNILEVAYNWFMEGKVSSNSYSIRRLVMDGIINNLQTSNKTLMTNGNVWIPYHLYDKSVDLILRKKLPDKSSDWSDIRQEIWIRAWKHQNTFDHNKGRYSTWLYKIMVNCISNYFKKDIKTSSVPPVPEDIPCDSTISILEIKEFIETAAEKSFPWCFLVFFLSVMLGWKPSKITKLKSSMTLKDILYKIIKDFNVFDLSKISKHLDEKLGRKLQDVLYGYDLKNRKKMEKYLSTIVEEIPIDVFYGTDKEKSIYDWCHEIKIRTMEAFLDK